MTKKTLKEYYTGVCDTRNCEYTEEGLLDHLVGRETVYTGESDQHRWYINNFEVKKLIIDGEDRFFNVCYPSCTGDGEIEWEEWEIPAEDYEEVYPKEVMTTVYTTTPQEIK